MNPIVSQPARSCAVWAARGRASAYLELEPPNVENQQMEQITGVYLLCELCYCFGYRLVLCREWSGWSVVVQGRVGVMWWMGELTSISVQNLLHLNQ